MNTKFKACCIALLAFLSSFLTAHANPWDEAIADPAAASLARPNAHQIAWHEQERIMFIHFGVATWEGTDYDADGKTDLSKMNPAGFDAEKICGVAKSWGAKEIILVCKHVGGFCWWQTNTTDYSVKSIPWKDGKGDLVKEVTEACRRHGLKMGIYIYSDDPRYASGIGRGGKTDDPARQEEWNGLLRQQWEEVLTLVGADMIEEVWFDGSCVVPLEDIITRLAPNAVILQSPLTNIRWVGNEAGIANDPNWNTLRTKDLKSGVATQEHSNPHGDAWAPVECDVTLYNHNWFWNRRNERKRRSVDELMSLYLQSAGRGSVLLLNSTPNTNGEIPEGDQATYKAFGEAIDANFGHPVGKTEKVEGNEVIVALDRSQPINCVDLWEDYQYGHRIRGYEVEALLNGAWAKVAEGTAVGRRKFDLFPEVTTDKIRVRVLDQVGTPLFRQVLVHKVNPALVNAVPKTNQAEDWKEVPVCVPALTPEGNLNINLSAFVLKPGQYEVRIEGLKITAALPLFEGQPGDGRFLEKLNDTTYRINRTQALGEGAATGIQVTVNGKKLGKLKIWIRAK